MLVIVLAWVVMELLINPRGNFPLNDDWWYARTVRILLTEHHLKLAYFPAMSLLAHVLWGALFSSVFGFSFHVLRLSTLVMGLAGIFVTYALLREIHASRTMAFVGAMAIALNPIYTELSNTFMTDVPFYALAVLSIYLYVRGLGRESKAAIIAGTLVACVAALIRQVGVIFPISFAVAYLVKNGLRTRTVLTAVVPVALGLATLLGYQRWLSMTGNMPSQYEVQTVFAQNFLHMGTWQMAVAVADFIRTIFVYLGLFLLPCLLLTLPRELKISRRSLLGWAPSMAFFALLMGSLIYADQWMPLMRDRGNILTDCQIGPVPIFDVWLLGLPYIEHAPRLLWQIVTIVGVAGAAILLRHVLTAIGDVTRRRKQPSPARWISVFVISVGVLYAGPLLLISKICYFDRYFLPLMPLLMVAACLASAQSGRISRVWAASALAVLLILGGFGVAGTHDYFGWNRARWKAYLDLVEVEKIPSTKVNGGYECNGWFSYREREDWEKFIDNTYVITLGPVDGYEVIEQYPVRNWLPYGQDEILVLRRL